MLHKNLIAAVAGLSVLGLQLPASAGGLGPKKASQLVTLGTVVTPCPGGFTGARQIDSRLLSDGTTTTFVVPAGQVFVMTTMEVRLNSSAASQSVEVRVGIPCGANCMQAVTDATVNTNASGEGGASLTFPSGIAIKPSVPLCVADVNFASPNVFATLYGYFTADK